MRRLEVVNVGRRLRSAVVGPELEQALGLPLSDVRDHRQNGIEEHDDTGEKSDAQGDGHDH